jgi:hypothetical protein
VEEEETIAVVEEVTEEFGTPDLKGVQPNPKFKYI